MDVDPRLISFLMDLRRRGMAEPGFLGAVEAAPRPFFLHDSQAPQAYDDAPLPLPMGEFSTPPLLAASMVNALGLKEHMKVLDVGTGTGYLAALIAPQVRRVYTIDLHAPLVRSAEKRFSALKLFNILTKVGDARTAWSTQAPFDAILVSAAVSEPPFELLAQLTEGGVLIAPCGEADALQLVRFVRDGDAAEAETLASPRIPPIDYMRAMEV